MNNSLKTRLISVLSAFSILLASVAAAGCSDKNAGSNSADTNADTTPSAETVGMSEEEMRLNYKDDLPEADFEGADFRSIVQNSTPYDIWVEGETGDALNDSIYARNRKVEERFDVKIAEAEAVLYSDIVPKVRNSVNADDDAYDLVLGQMEDSGAGAITGIFMNWYDIPNLNFAKPWYPKSIIENAATVNGKMFSMLSDLCVSYAEQTWLLVYDKAVAANYSIPDIYSEVRGGTWTLDRLSELTKDVYSDVNGNGKKDTNDYYGLTIGLNGCMLLAFFYGFDQRLVTVDADLQINTEINTEKSEKIVEKFKTLFYETEGVWNCTDSSNAGIYAKFVNGTALFCPIQAQYMYSQLRTYENDYGVLPFPKWDEAQDEYYSVCDAGCNILAVPVTASATEMIGTVVEALSADSWRSVLPTYYDVALDVKSTRDEESVEMLNIIMNSRIIDFAYLYDGWNGWVFTLPKFISNKNGFASEYASSEAAKTKYYEKVLDFFVNAE